MEPSIEAEGERAAARVNNACVIAENRDPIEADCITTSGGFSKSITALARFWIERQRADLPRADECEGDLRKIGWILLLARIGYHCFVMGCGR